ncbi:Lrp/AsnC family transcriptional regulator [Subtercola vilae]|uniref:Lrp/AsnC family transcriptional regulator n=1 Tax=Subtercola vilae TaxID=2056433 RepID=A0A4V4RD73_9MICO|nr:Lrp/AsnC family transcriptional regulator [Subtercola vilae]TIH28924.1 Lrp/AsnC family transcriptional regulator [Subtercola vilae]
MSTLDGTDRRILRALDDEPRAPVMLLAERLGLARATVQTRLERMAGRAAGAGAAGTGASGTPAPVLRPNSVRIEPSALGFGLRAFVTAEVDQELFDQTITALTGIPEVIECSAIAGADDIICQVIARNADHLYEVGQAILRCRGIRRTSTSIVLRQLMPYRTAQLLSP